MPHSVNNTVLYNEDVSVPNEVTLGGIRFPVKGPIRRRSITPLAPKTTTGDYTRQDKVVESEWIISDFSGGSGIQFARAGRDDNRYDIGDLETRYRYLTLGPEVKQAGTLTGPLDVLIDYNEVLYAVKGGAVYAWNENSATWVAEVDLDSGTGGNQGTLTGTYRSACVYDGSLYILTSSNLYRLNTSTWTTQAAGGYALVAFDDKLWRLDNSNVMQWAITSTITSWTAGGTLRMPVTYCKQLIEFFDQTGLPAIHAITRLGVYGYDVDTARFYKTPLTHPLMASAGQGACVWQGALWVPVGASIYKYTGSVVQAAGPDKDDGLPSELQGNTLQVIPGHASLFCIVNATGASTTSTPVGKEELPEYLIGLDIQAQAEDAGAPNVYDPPGMLTTFGDVFMTGSSGNGAVFTSHGASWYMLKQHLNAGGMGAAHVAGLSSSYRLWWSTRQAVYYIGLPTGLHNPLRNPTTRYTSSGYLFTPRSDMGWAEVPKIAVSVDTETEQTSATETLDVYLSFDGGAWEHIGQVADELDDDNGTKVFRLGPSGEHFHDVRAWLQLASGNVLKTPIVKSVSLGYLRLPTNLEGWNLTLDLSDIRCRSLGKSADEMVALLYSLKAERKVQTFTYRGEHQQPYTNRVWMHELVGAEPAGQSGGTYDLFLLEVDV